MSNVFIFANNAASSLAAPISNTATSLSVQSGQGSEFPQPSSGQQFSATLTDAATGLLTEIVYCTAVTGDTFNPIVRAQEGTTALNWLAGDLIANVLTAGQMAAMVQSVSLAPSRIVTTSGAFTTTSADANGFVGIQRTSGVAAASTTLPNNLQPGETITYEDLVGNGQAAAVTFNASSGQSIAGQSAFVANWNRFSVTFTYYGSNVYGVARSG